MDFLKDLAKTFFAISALIIGMFIIAFPVYVLCVLAVTKNLLWFAGVGVYMIFLVSVLITLGYDKKRC